MADDFATDAARYAISEAEERLIQSQRNFEDAQRSGDQSWGGSALAEYNRAKIEYDALTGANQPRQQQQQLSPAAQQYLQRRVAGGDQLTPQRQMDYLRAHNWAVGGLQPDSPQYFAAISRHVDSLGDGRQPPLTESAVAKMCGISEEEYSAQAHKLQALKRAGHYNE